MDGTVSGQTGMQVITIVGGHSGMTSSLMRLARQLRLQLMIDQITAAELERRILAADSGVPMLHVDDIPLVRSRDWQDWDNVQLSASYGYYEGGNSALVEARRDCPHGVVHRERARRCHQRNVGWKRFSARCSERQERIRPRVGSRTVEPSRGLRTVVLPLLPQLDAGRGKHKL